MKRENVTNTENLTKEERAALKKESKALRREQRNNGNKPKKKKKLGCCGCLGIIALVFVLIIGAGVGVGWYYGNNYLKANFGFTLKQAFSVVGELYNADGEKIVTNAPADGDKSQFYSKVNDELYLNDGTLTEEKFQPVIDEVMGKDSNSGDTSGEGGNDGGSDGPVALAKPLYADGSAASKFEEILNRDNIDFTKITDESLEIGVKITDRELMSLFKPIITDALGKKELIANNVTIEQLVLMRTDDDVPAMKVTAKLKTLELITELTKDAGLPGIAKTAIKTLAPKVTYVNVTLVLGETATGEISINQMNKTDIDVVYKLISKLANKDAQKVINDFIANNLQSTINKLDDFLDFDENIENGKIELDVFELLVKTIFKGKEDLTGKSLEDLYVKVLTADTDKMLQQNERFMFTNQWQVGDEVKYSATPVTGGTLIDYKDEFMTEFTNKYLISTDFYRDGAGKTYLPSVLSGEVKSGGNYIAKLYLKHTDGDGKVVNEVVATPTTGYDTEINLIQLEFADVAALMGIGASDKIANIDLQALFDSHRLTQGMGGVATSNKSEWYVNQELENIKLNITDKMLATLVSEQLDSVVGTDSKLTSSLELKFIALSGTDMTLGFMINPAEAFEGVDIVSKFLGDRLGLIAKVDIDITKADGEHAEPIVKYASYSEKQTETMLKTLKALGMEMITPAKIDELIGAPIRDALKTVQTTIGGDVDFIESNMIVPDVFTLLTAQMFPVNESKTYGGNAIRFADGEIYEMMHGLYALPNVITDGSSGVDRHYLANELNAYTNVFEHNGVFYANLTTKADKLNEYLSMSSSALGQLGINLPQLHGDLGEVIGYYYDTVNADVMFLAYKYSIKDYLGDGDSTASSLLTTEEIYAIFEVDMLSHTAKMSINLMSEAQKTTLEKVMTYFDGTKEGDLDNVAQSVADFAVQVAVLDGAGRLD